uniref:BPI2 domain-containing protein n=1 Tax=Onchocerca flexuosa TaxID=387005 RepID=A0A183H0D3_9BILA
LKFFGDKLFFISEYLFKKHVKQIIIPPQQQCFPEGCIKIQNFQLIAHQNPSHVGVVPTPPNLLTLRISGFSFYIAGTLYGQLQPIPLLPVVTVSTYGTLAISANQLVVEATFDIQKTVDNVPYIRVVSCSLINDVTVAQVENMGLLTVIVNTKYQYEITIKTREILEETLCTTVNNVVNDELNSQLYQIPSQISISDLY